MSGEFAKQQRPSDEHMGESDDGDALRIDIDGELIFDEGIARRCRRAVLTGIVDPDLTDTLKQMADQEYPSHRASYFITQLSLSSPDNLPSN